MNFEIFDTETVMSLSLSSIRSRHVIERNVSEVSERLIRSAAILPKDGFLGFQIEADKDGTFRCFAFSGPGLKVSAEDYGWIFRECADVDTESIVTPGKLTGKGRKLYRLSPVAGFKEGYTEDTRSAGKDGNGSSSTKMAEQMRESCLKEMPDMFSQTDAIIRIIAGNTFREDGCGTVLLSVKGEMSLRMKSALSLAFPDMIVSEAADFEKGEGYLPGPLLTDSMTKIFYTVIDRIGENGNKNSENPDSGEGFEDDFIEVDESDFENEEEVSDSFTPVEELELSVRAYNCLRRAGIESVEELRKMTEEDLLKVRNLGRKCTTEVLEKLAQYKSEKKAAPRDDVNYMEELDSLIGLTEVKKQVRRIAAFAKMKKAMAAGGRESVPVSLNMVFKGNPGTAKTTVARILAGILHEIGLLKSSEIVETGRADLVGKYVGHTAGKVKEVFERAKGRVLFIDEAYSLVDSQRGDFGDEAINTIVQEMENNREDTVVIFAGYPDRMDEFILRNPGLRSRIPFSISFTDYSPEEMLKITEREAVKKGFSIDPGAVERILGICKNAEGNEEAGNGRFCRNLVEDAILNYAERVYGNTGSEGSESGFAEPGNAEPAELILLREDFSGQFIPDNTKKSNPIGFRA
ncbi:MAG: AAA family ATPase [Lachnospiraceae bacterium]|nr:AAA family ATPase [Lachnospiraceae bacterium]